MIHLMKSPAVTSHKQILKCLISVMLEPKNKMNDLMSCFNNLDISTWSPLIEELTLLNLQRNSKDKISVNRLDSFYSEAGSTNEMKLRA